ISVPSLPELEADKTQMHQLFKNLLSNSLKYAKADEPPRISMEVEMNGDRHYLISIRDNGIGIDEKYKEKIFKPFERLHGQSQYSGTGIGLAICKKVVESHNPSGGSPLISPWDNTRPRQKHLYMESHLVTV
ncbi:MAG: ATP-binding protein, partial [Nitrospinaceae bacterium]|nr:ATP-binding protein [Nitrospinaceae bacterium]